MSGGSSHMSCQPGPSKFNSRLGLDAFSKWMFGLLHLGNKMCLFDQLLLGTTAGNHDMLHERPGTKDRQYVFNSHIVMLESDIELVENDHGVGCVLQKFARRHPSLLRKRCVALPILCFPGIPFTHAKKGDSLAERLE